MDLLKNWLSSTVEQELNVILEKAKAYGEISTARDVSYEDDGSNLRVTSSKSGIIQIIKFTNLENPIQVYISDSTTRIQATIAASAVRKYEEDTDKRFTEGTLGGLFQITDFEIVATHLGPRASRLTLLIKKLESIGSNGSGQFGMPQAIENQAEFFNLLDKLSAFRAQHRSGSEVQSGFDDSTRGSSIFSQVEPTTSDDSARSSGQALFATQVTRPLIVKKKKNAPLEPSTNGNPKESTALAAATIPAQIISKLSTEVVMAETIPSVSKARVKPAKGPILGEVLQPPVSRSSGGDTSISVLKASPYPSALLELLIRNRQPKDNLKPDEIKICDKPIIIHGDENTTQTHPIINPDNSTAVNNQTPIVGKTTISPFQGPGEVRKEPATENTCSGTLKNEQLDPLITTQAIVKDHLMLPETAASATSFSDNLPQLGCSDESRAEAPPGTSEKISETRAQNINIVNESLCTGDRPSAAEILPDRKSCSTVEPIDFNGSMVHAITTECPKNKEDGAPAYLGLTEYLKYGCKRRKIGRREVVVPNDQIYLLGRSDSWLPAEPGERSPAQNLPIQLLDKLNVKADRQVSRSDLSQEDSQSLGLVNERQESPAIDQESEHNENEGVDAEIVCSSSDWPPTPPMYTSEQLPPDSSVENESYVSEKMSQSKPNCSEVQAKRRAASPFHSFADPTLASETRLRPYKPSIRESSVSQTSTTASLDPADSSTGEESIQFSCPAPGCKKTYRTRNGLKYHTERRHRSKRGHEIFDKDKIESRKEISRNLEVDTDRDATCDKHISSAESMDNERWHLPCSPPPCTQQDGFKRDSYDPGDDEPPEENNIRGTQRETPEAPGYRKNSVSRVVEITTPAMDPSIASSLTPSCLDHISQSQYGAQASPSQSSIAQDPSSSLADSTNADTNLLQTLLVEDSVIIPFSTKYSIHSDLDSDSEIEVEIPSALGQESPVAPERQRQDYLSTVSQSSGPLLQVKRTPYSHGSDLRLNFFQAASSALIPSVNSRLSEKPFRSEADVEWTQSTLVIGTHSPHSSLVSSKSDYLLNRTTFSSETEVEHNYAVSEDNTIMPGRSHYNPGASFQRSRRFGKMRTEHDPSPKEQVNQAAQPQIMSADQVETKRKASMVGLLSPNVTKRLKNYKRPTAFDFSQDRSAVQDPVVLGRTYRQEFLANRKNSMPTSTDKLNLQPQADRFADAFREDDGRPRTAPIFQIPPTQHTLGAGNAETVILKSSASASNTSDWTLRGLRDADATAPRSYDEAEIIPSVEGGIVAEVFPSAEKSIQLQIDEDVRIMPNHANPLVDHETCMPNDDPDHSGGTTEEKDWEIEGSARLVPRLSSSARSMVESRRSSGAIPRPKAALSPYSIETDQVEAAPNPEASAEKPKLQNVDANSLTMQSTVDHFQEGCQHTFAADVVEAAQGESCSRHSTPSDQIRQTVAGAISAEKRPYTDVSDVKTLSAVQENSQFSLLADFSTQESTKCRTISPQHESMTGPTGVFAQFKVKYPEYTGDIRHFVAICKKIHALVKANRMVPKFLWDDFIVRHKLDYPQYLQDCNDLAEDPIPYEQFYHDMVTGPKYMSNVLSLISFCNVLELDKNELTDNASLDRAERSTKSPKKDQATSIRELPTTLSLIEEPQHSQEFFPQNSSKILIDLTADEPEIVESLLTLSLSKVSPLHTTSRKPLPTQEPRTEAPLPRTSFASRASIYSDKRPRRPLPWTEESSPTAKLPSLGKPITTGRSPLSSLASTPSKASASQTHASLITRPALNSTSRRPPPKPSAAHHLVSKSIHHRNPPRDADHLTSSPSFPSPELDTAAETVAATPTADWYRDDNTPFKDFAKAYTSIQPGKGNSFAQPGVLPKERREKKEPRKLDIWSWKLN